MRMHYEEIELSTGTGVGTAPISRCSCRICWRARACKMAFCWCRASTPPPHSLSTKSESRLLDDLRLFLHRLAPPGDAYLHNDIHLRDCPPGEPKNAHAHLGCDDARLQRGDPGGAGSAGAGGVAIADAAWNWTVRGNAGVGGAAGGRVDSRCWIGADADAYRFATELDAGALGLGVPAPQP